jgi:hypothetical protein
LGDLGANGIPPHRRYYPARCNSLIHSDIQLATSTSHHAAFSFNVPPFRGVCLVTHQVMIFADEVSVEFVATAGNVAAFAFIVNRE